MTDPRSEHALAKLVDKNLSVDLNGTGIFSQVAEQNCIARGMDFKGEMKAGNICSGQEEVSVSASSQLSQNSAASRPRGHVISNFQSQGASRRNDRDKGPVIVVVQDRNV